MSVINFLEEKSDEIINHAVDAIRGVRLNHYEVEGAAKTSHRLETFYSLIKQCIRTDDAAALVQHAREVAEERFYAGFDLGEVQTVLNVLEEAIWKEVFSALDPELHAEAIGVVGKVLNLGKDSLARAYVSLATGKRVANLDLKQLSRGVEGFGNAELYEW